MIKTLNDRIEKEECGEKTERDEEKQKYGEIGRKE